MLYVAFRLAVACCMFYVVCCFPVGRCVCCMNCAGAPLCEHSQPTVAVYSMLYGAVRCSPCFLR